MLNSMTGFARLCREIDNVSYAVELRTVNNRYYKSSIRLPETAAFVEQHIDALLKKSIHRGAVSCYVRFKNINAEPMYEIDTVALQSYANKLGNIELPKYKDNCRINISELLNLPGVVRPQEPEDEQAEILKKNILHLVSEAVEKLVQMRALEGKALAEDMLANLNRIKQLLDKIGQRSPVVVDEYKKRLANRIKQLLDNARLELDADTLARETAVFADRSDISEELIRLGSHIDQFMQSCEAAAMAGKKLDFLSQEMLREANTIASKASDAVICSDVVQIKTCIERIKEQVQNVE